MHESAPRLQQQQLSPWLQISQRRYPSLSLFTYFDISHSSLLYRSTCTLVNTSKCILPWGLVAYTILKGMMRRRKIDAMTGLAILDPLSVQST
jgi:hypothetical protein